MDKMKITMEVFVVLKHAPARKIILSHNTEERKKERKNFYFSILSK